jgi:hypothetical protein
MVVKYMMHVDVVNTYSHLTDKNEGKRVRDISEEVK